MTILYALLVLIVTMLFTTITFFMTLLYSYSMDFAFILRRFDEYIFIKICYLHPKWHISL